MSLQINQKLLQLDGNANISTITDMLFEIDDSITVKRFSDNDTLFLVHKISIILNSNFTNSYDFFHFN